MLNRAAPLLALSSLSLFAACSASTGEAVDSSHEALYLAFANLSVTPADTTITIAYEEPGTTPLAVTLGGRTLTATVNPAGTTQNQSVVFTGLQPCTSYSWSVPAPSGTVTGKTNTRWTGNTACSASDVLKADRMWTFGGAEHQEENNFGCGGWSSSWPVGYGWTSLIYPTGGTFSTASFGYEHFSNNSSFCAESTVRVWRTRLQYDIAPTQFARGIQRSVVTGKYVSNGNAVPAKNPVCATNIALLHERTWPSNDQMGLWAPIVNGGANNTGISQSGEWTFTIGASNGAVSIIIPELLSPTVDLGFVSPIDGFPDLSADGTTKTWAADNNECTTSLTNLALTLTYAPLPPETPLCTATIGCTTSVTCAPSPETFILETSAGAVLGTFDGTGGATPAFTIPNGAAGTTYQACTQNSVGTQLCAPVVVSSITACACQPSTCVPGTCGTESDGCGGTLDCGTCGSGGGCSSTIKCGPGHYLNEKCVCVADFCACGGIYPSCKVCQ